MKRIATISFLCLAVLLLIGATITNRFPLLRAYLQGPLDGGGQSVTNLGSMTVSNLTVQGSASGVVINLVTNGDSSISVVSNAGNFTLRATNITELKLSLSDNTTANVSASAHGLIPKLTT